MKVFTALFMLVGFALVISAYTPSSEVAPAPPKFKMPKSVNKIVQDKCYGCHNVDGRSDKAKEALLWDDLASLSPDMVVEKMKSIQHVLDEGSMPPAKMLERMPEKALSDKERSKMAKWAGKLTKKMM